MGGDVLALSREQGEVAAGAALAALLAAGPDGLTPGEAVTRSGLPERRWRRAVDRLEAEGKVRRDGRRRVFAVATAAGELVPANDAASVAERSAAEARDLAWRRGWVLGEITDARSLLDGRRVPAPAGGRARASRDYLAELARSVEAARSRAELDALTAEGAPVLREVVELVRAVEAGRAEVDARKAWAAGELVRVEAQARQLRAELVELDRAAAAWQRVPNVPFGTFAAVVARAERNGRMVAYWAVEHFTAQPEPMSRVRKAGAIAAALADAYTSTATGRRPAGLPGTLDPSRTLVRIWSAVAPGEEVRAELVGHLSAPPADLRIGARFAVLVLTLVAGVVRDQLSAVETRRVELAQAKAGGSAALSRAVVARLGPAPLLEPAPGLPAVAAR